jgi:hypothetical protein
LAVSDSDYSLDFENIDFRERPYLYRVGRGEQGVLSVEPYKSELLPHWRFRTEEVRPQEPGALDNEKARAARVFYEKYVLAREDDYYKLRKKEWVSRDEPS